MRSRYTTNHPTPTSFDGNFVSGRNGGHNTDHLLLVDDDVIRWPRGWPSSLAVRVHRCGTSCGNRWRYAMDSAVLTGDVEISVLLMRLCNLPSHNDWILITTLPTNNNNNNIIITTILTLVKTIVTIVTIINIIVIKFIQLYARWTFGQINSSSGGDLFVNKISFPFLLPLPSFPLPPILCSIWGLPLNPAMGSGSVWALSGFGQSPTAKSFMVHFELKILPLATQNQKSTTYLCKNWNSELILNANKRKLYGNYWYFG